jgi:hypothetical protein
MESVTALEQNHLSTDMKSAGAIMESVTALEQNHRSTDMKSAGAIMESVTALEQNHLSTDVKSAGAAFESGRRDARPTLSVPTVWQRSQDVLKAHSGGGSCWISGARAW